MWINGREQSQALAGMHSIGSLTPGEPVFAFHLWFNRLNREIGAHQAKFLRAIATISSKPFGSLIAISDKILRFTLMFARWRAPINLL